MNNSSRGPDNLDPKLLKRFPMLREIQEEKGRLGPVRVLRKSPKEIKKVLKALPNQYFDFEYYDCRGDALQFGYEDHLILWLELHIENVPVFTQTVVYLYKEETIMFTIEQLSQIKKAADTLWNLLDVQLAEINEPLLDKIIERAYKNLMEEQGADTIYKVQDDYLKAARAEIIKYNYSSWDEALINISGKFGFNGISGEWDVQNPKEYWTRDNAEVVSKERVYFLAKSIPDSIGFNILLTAVKPISKEEYDKLPKLSLIGGSGGYVIYEKEEDMDKDYSMGIGGDAEMYISDDESEVAFGLLESEVGKLYDMMFKSNGRAYFAFRV